MKNPESRIQKEEIKLKRTEVRAPFRLLAVCMLFLMAAHFDIQAQTANVTFHATDYTTAPSGQLARAVLTPLGPQLGYNGAILTLQPITRVTDTNGFVTFTNVITGYNYIFELDTAYGKTMTTNGFPVGLTGNVNGLTYQGYIVATNIFAYLYQSNALAAISNSVLLTVTNTTQGVTNLGASTGTFQFAADTNIGGKIYGLVWDASGFTLGNGAQGNIRVAGAGVSGLTGILSANQFYGDGALVSNLNAGSINAGTLSAARLPASVVTSNYSSAVSLTNIQNSIVASNVLLSAGGVAARGSFLWNGGALSSPDDPGFLWFDNTNHGTTQGNASELQWSFNQMYFGPANGLHVQFGLNSDSLGDAFVMQWIGTVLTNYNRTHLLGFHDKIVPGDAYMHFWADTYGDTNRMQLHLTGMVDGGNQDWVQRGSDKMVIDREGQMQLPGAIATGFTNAAATGTNYGINWVGPETQEIDLAADLNLYETNFNLYGNFTNFVSPHRRLIIYPGQGNWNWTTPAGWPAPTVDYGVATNTFPTVLTNSLIAILDISKTIGASATNTFVKLSYQPYSPAYDSSANNFFTLATFTTTEKIAINQLILDMKAASIFTGAFDFVHPQCGSTSNSTKWNVVATNKFPITWNIPASIVFGSQGAYGNGGTTWGDTGFNPSSAPSPNFVQNSAILGFYSKFNPGYTNGGGSTGNGQSTIGANFVAATKGATEFTTAGNSNAATTIQWNGFNNNQQTAFTYGAGFQFANRTGATTCTYVSGANSATDANATTGVNTQNFYLLANDDGGAFRFSTNAIAIDWCGRGLNSTEMNAWSNAVLRFVTTLGRQ